MSPLSVSLLWGGSPLGGLSENAIHQLAEELGKGNSATLARWLRSAYHVQFLATLMYMCFPWLDTFIYQHCVHACYQGDSSEHRSGSG